MFGGDEVYPTASQSEYKRRTFTLTTAPFEAQHLVQICMRFQATTIGTIVWSPSRDTLFPRPRLKGFERGRLAVILP